MTRRRDPYQRFLVDLRARRKRQGLTQEQVAKGIKLSRAQYTAIERGRSMVNWRHLHALSGVLKTRFVIGAT